MTRNLVLFGGRGGPVGVWSDPGVLNWRVLPMGEEEGVLGAGIQVQIQSTVAAQKLQ